MLCVRPASWLVTVGCTFWHQWLIQLFGVCCVCQRPTVGVTRLLAWYLVHPVLNAVHDYEVQHLSRTLLTLVVG